jgi:hypothetical protein
VTIFLNVTQCCHEEHAKQWARSKQRGVYFFLVACLSCCLNLKLEAVLSFEMSMNFNHISRHDVPEDTNTLLSQKICLQTPI